MAYFMFALGLYLLSHHLENKGAKAIINKELRTPNQEAGTSVTSCLNCSLNIHIAIIHIITKLSVKKILDLDVNNLDDANSHSLKAEYYKKNLKLKSKNILKKINKIKNYGKKNSLKS